MRTDQEKKRNLELLGQHAKGAAFNALFERIDIEIEDCRDGMELAIGDDVIKLQMAIVAYRGLKTTILNAEEVIKRINADTPK